MLFITTFIITVLIFIIIIVRFINLIVFIEFIVSIVLPDGSLDIEELLLMGELLSYQMGEDPI